MSWSARIANWMERTAQGLRATGGGEAYAGALMDAGWWGVSETSSGESVSADSSLTLSTVWACVRLISETIGALPLHLYEMQENGDRRLAREHPLYEVLNAQPNATQTAAEFWQMMVAHVLLRGNAYARIEAGARGQIVGLIPLHPDRVMVEQLGDGRLRYRHEQRVLLADEVMHLRGFSLDGIMGLSVVAYARESLGLGLGAERYGSRFFGNDSRPGGVLHTDKDLDIAGRDRAKVDRLRQMWAEAHSRGNQHRVAILPNGLQWQQVGIAPEEAQFLQTREFQAEEICRWFGVPPHLVGLTTKTTSWGSGIEQMGTSFVTYTLMPYLSRISQAVRRDLELPDRLFAEHVTQALLRGNLLDRYGAYQIGRTNGWLSANEIRRFENMNAIAGGDAYLTPLNMRDSSATLAESEPAQPVPQAVSAHHAMVVREAAGRVVRKEATAVPKLLARDGGEALVREFYREHATLVADTLQIEAERARAWCDGRAEEMLAGTGGDVAEATERLTALALEDEHGF